MHAYRTAAASAALAVFALLSACGGGGGGDDLPTLQVTFAQPTLALSTPAALNGQVAQVAVTVSPTPPASAVVQLAQSPAFFDLAGLTIIDEGGGHYLVDLPIPDGSAAGTHAGTLTFKICQDQACARPYPLSRSTLPYLVEVLPQTVASGTVAYSSTTLFDLAWDDEAGRVGYMSFTIDPVPSTPPVLVVLDGGGFFTPGPAEVIEFRGSYYAYLPYPDGRLAGDHTGEVTLQICSDATCTAAYALPQPTLPYDITIHHVQTGLPPLTAAFTLDGAAVTSVNEGLNGTGDRTYAVDLRAGQVLEVQLSVAAVSIYRGTVGDTATLARLPSTYPVHRYQASLPVGAVAGVGSLRFRVPDGRWVHLTLHVTP